MQPKVKAQKISRDPVEGTVPWGRHGVYSKSSDRDSMYSTDTAFSQGKANGDYVKKIPMDVTSEVIYRGMDRYNIYCAPCHDQAGTGKGPVASKGIGLVPDFNDDKKFSKMADGLIFETISSGKGTMPGYSKQIDVTDRWAIVSYVRALRNMKSGSMSDLNNEEVKRLK